MLDSLTQMLIDIDKSYPALQFFMGYVLLLAVGIFIIALIFIIPRDSSDIIFNIGDKLLSFIIVIAFVIWSLYCLIFVFPFHCFKNRRQLSVIRRNKKISKK